MRDLAGVAAVLAALGALMFAVRALQCRGRVDPELARKLVHMGMGTVCLTFPWVFVSPEPVWVLAALAATSLIAIRRIGSLRRALGSVLGGVERSSWGEVYFPISVALVFTWAGGDPARFCAPVAILAYADAAGALVGRRWGRTRFRAVESFKTVEGSLAVFGVTWVVVMIALALGTDAPWAGVVLTGIIVGAFAALVEAVSWRGLDNLLVPLVALAQLRAYPELSLIDLVGRAGVMALLVVVMLNWRKRLLDFSARLGAALALFVFWSLGDWRWLVAPVVLLVSYVHLMPRVPWGPGRHHLAAVLCVGSAGLLWAFLNARSEEPRWLWWYTLGFATQQAIIAAVRFSQGRPHWRRTQWWAIAWLQAVGTQVLAFLLVNGVGASDARVMAIGAGVLAVALAGFMVWDRELALPDDLNARWWRQGVTAVLAPLGGFALMNV